MDDEPEQEALFELQGPDEDGRVWACSPEGRDVWCQNLGPVEKVVDVMSRWLGSIYYDELEARKQPRPRTVEQPDSRAQRLEENAKKRADDANAEEDTVDAMIRKSIKDHGA